VSMGPRDRMSGPVDSGDSCTRKYMPFGAGERDRRLGVCGVVRARGEGNGRCYHSGRSTTHGWPGGRPTRLVTANSR
jgi:hypothetical protein